MMRRAVPPPDAIAIRTDLHIDRDRTIWFTPHRSQCEALAATRDRDQDVGIEGDGQVATRESIAQFFDEERDGAVQRATGQLPTDGKPDADVARLHETADRI